ncbi:cell wall metabolism sensor histidine kinase WalK [Lysinibacillus sp. BPa_S21]|uniref:sensor histidine kinase n=1 Tax=Lysinibacillus sp. BPa_S21 TaxID=2932478 RepID=UPI0020132761|nr:HAMP domain-containing sensor histidine kinase [Lysinibacillus sp. BPa_S21]MCL1697276.1 HAMP domain-containing histidine kinase [Lysinibacillus sp. BPa_S21]
MKIKTFLFTFILFLLFFYSGILLISSMTLINNLESSKDRSLREHYFIATSYAKDLNALENRDVSIDSGVESLYRSYFNFYSKQKVILTISKENKRLYANLTEESYNLPEISENIKVSERLVSIEKLEDKDYVRVVGTLPAPYDSYTLAYYYNVSDVISSWYKMTVTLFLIGMLICGLLAVCLLFVLNRVFKPLQLISSTSKSIANGQYGNRIEVKGDDELAEMAQSFNHMAEEIQSQMQQLAIAAEQKQQFVDNLAHELRTPLTSIYGYAEYIQKIVRTEEDRIFATNYIMSECRRLQNISVLLLEMATLRTSESERKKIEMSELIRDVEQSLSMKAKEKQIEISYEHHFNTLFCDADLMHILLVNLIDNALKASSSGGLITLNAYIENEHKVIVVQDNGKGMSKEHLNHITEAFYRVDSSRSRSAGGAGLGLTLCKQIAVNHHAELSFSSEIGKGTTAKLTFTS